MKCKNCDSTESIETIQAKGYMSCCPEREIVGFKDLTDKEIWECHDKTNTNNWVIDFARAILRKAQET